MAGKNNALKYILIGCGALVVIGLAILGGLFYFGYKTAKDIQEGLENPGPMAMEMLGTESFPEGYHPVMSLNLIFMKVVMLSDIPKVEGEEHKGRFNERGFLYFYLGIGDDRQEVRDYFEGKTDDPRVLKENGIDIDMDEVITRGIFNHDGKDYLYVTFRGMVSVSEGGGSGLNTMFLVECPGDKKLRMGTWMGKDPDPSVPAEAVNLAGTTGDLDALKDFISNFDFCK